MSKLKTLSPAEIEKRIESRGVPRRKELRFGKEILSLKKSCGVEITEELWEEVCGGSMSFKSLPSYYYSRPETKGKYE